MRTLLVEDDPGQRQTLASWLDELGLDVTVLADAHKGLMEHLRCPFDLLVVDWVMPGMDGLQLCHRIRSMPDGDRPYVLVVTGRDRASDLTEVLDSGANDYMAKPIERGLLQTRIRIAERRVASDKRHREAREALARSEADFRRVIERSPLGVFAHQDGAIAYVNAAACSTFGEQSAALIGTPFVTLVRQPFRDVAEKRAARFERTQVPPPPMEMELERPDGTIASVRCIPATAATYEGQRACFTILEDVTERLRAERELRTTQFAVDHAADAAFWVGSGGNITYANHAASRLCGYSRPDLVGRNFYELDPGAGRELFSRGSVQRESALVHRDGHSIPVEVTANVVELEGDKFLIVFARDLSERRRLQAGLQRADRLASVGALAAGVAHEINNPLAYIISNLELLAEETDGLGAAFSEVAPRFGRVLRQVTEGAHRVRRIVGDLKSFARVDEDETPRPVQVHDVLDVAIDIARNEIRHRATLVREYGDLPAVWGNSGRLTQVFLNLLVNAAHAIPENSSQRDTITVRTHLDGDEWVVVEIEDTGLGMSTDVVDRIFDPFFTTKPQGMGTGLGLSICHGIVTSMGGEVTVRSQPELGPGQGTTFSLRLAVAQAQTHPKRRKTWPELPRIKARSLRILVVDDEPLICDGIRRALVGHNVEVASGGRDAIRLCESLEFDLILCDVMMPDISGMEVFGRVRNTKPGFEARFVFMTGGAFTPKARDFLESIDNEQIIKPFSLRELRTLVARHAS